MYNRPADPYSAAQLKKDLLRELHDRIIPWVKADGVSRLVLAQWPLHLPPHIEARRYPMTPLPSTRSGWQTEVLASWADMGMKSLRHPYIGFVLEGEADLRVGVTQHMSQAPGQHDAEAEGCHVLTLRAGDGLLYPPGVPLDGRGCHWWRPHPEQAYSRILWIKPTPSGGYCHICATRGIEHPSQPCAFVRDAQLSPLAGMLIEELSERVNFGLIAQGLLLTLVARMERALATMPAFLAHVHKAELQMEPDEPAADATEPGGSPIVKRASKFIGMHLGHELTPTLIARRVFVSPSYLNRMFQAELGLPVMRYVTQCRMEAAKGLLLETELAVATISRMVGYQTPTNFTRAFAAWTGAAPLGYRQQNASPGQSSREGLSSVV